MNGTAVERERVSDFLDDENGAHVRRWRETLPNGASYETMDIIDRGILDNPQEYIVPPDKYFLIGDDRDNSVDSRVLSAVGYVPMEKLFGVVEIIWMSVKPNSPAGQAAIRSDRVGLTLLQGSGARQRGRPQRTRGGRSPT